MTTHTALVHHADPPRQVTASRPLRIGGTALMVGGPLSFVFHVLWRMGHGPTVVNEHGIVLGLTNDQWSYLGGIWALLVAGGVVTICRLHRGRLSTIAAALTIIGLLLGALASWVWPLYSIGALVQYAGMLCLGTMLIRTGVVPRYAGTMMLLAVALFLPMPIAPDLPYVVIPTGLPFGIELQDMTVLAAAAAWTALGWAVAAPRGTGRRLTRPRTGRVGVRRGPARDGSASDAAPHGTGRRTMV